MIFRRKQHERELARLRMEAQLQSELASAAIAQLHEQRGQYESRIADLKEVHELRHKETLRTIKALADEVEFQRAKYFGPMSASTPYNDAMPIGPEPDFMPGFAENPHYMSEEVEDIAALRAGGHISAVEHDQALRQLRAAVGGVPLLIEQS